MKASSLSVCIPLAYPDGKRPKCNARCPFCVSRMTMSEGVLHSVTPVGSTRNLHKAAGLARDLNATSALLTGRGEPTLYPNDITEALKVLKLHGYPLIDLQTNGLVFDTAWELYEPYLREWFDLGLTYISFSVIHHESEPNHKVYNPYAERYMDLREIIAKLHEIGFKIRLSVIMVKDGIDNPAAIKKLMEVAQKWGVEQLTVRPVAMPDVPVDSEVGEATKKMLLSKRKKRRIAKWLAKNATKVMTLPHGALVYDYHGQNICLTDCLTIQPKTDDLRQIIYENDGVFFDWRYRGARLI